MRTWPNTVRHHSDKVARQLAYTRPIGGSNPPVRTMKIKRKYTNEKGEKVVVMDISKEFNKFIKENDKLLRELSKH